MWPRVSVDNAAHLARRKNGHMVLPVFNAYAPDLKTVYFCYTSGHCATCRDSQTIASWMLGSMRHFLGSEGMFRTWLDMAEGFWKQFCFSPYHARARAPAA